MFKYWQYSSFAAVSIGNISLNLLDFCLVQSNLTTTENQTYRLHYFGSQRQIGDSTKPL